ncbi:MAG: HlyD family efflux transporter periplasmic adaptor subunit [Ruminococcus sp.]|nr:HlyD family efflux transporter periplasmic adaptor subunit [Ruminococcus sp.]
MSVGKSIAKALAAVIVIGGLGVGGWYLYKNYAGPTSSKTEKVYVQKVSNVNTVTSADLFTNSFAGVIVAQKTVDVKYDSTKTIDEILVANGDKVKKGDKLLTYNIEAIQLKIDSDKLEVERLESEISSNNDQIEELEEQKKKASEEMKASYTSEILSLQSANAMNEYEIKTKNVEISKQESSLKNAYVSAPIDGTVKDLKDPGSTVTEFSFGGSEDPETIMKITAEGSYRVKGVFNEQNGADIYEGAPVILTSRVDDTTWAGTISEIDTSPQTDNNNMYYYYESDEQTSSSKYAFYVEPESLDGFMLGQHILIDIDNGIEETRSKTGIWLYSDFLMKDGGKYYVWARNGKDRIEKRYVEVGETDEDYGDVQILSGLESDDYIAFPADYIEEGLMTTTNQSDKDIPDNELGEDGMFGGEAGYEDGMYEEGGYEDEGSTFTDEDGNVFYSDPEGNTTITSPDGGVIIVDSQGNFIAGGVTDEGELEFSYGDEPADIGEGDMGGEEAAESGKVSSEEPDVTFEDIYGISEEEFNSMSPEELDAFLKAHYAEQ